MDANIQWVENLTFLATSNSGHGIIMDAPINKGGNNRGPTPMEMLLMGAGGCTGIDVISILKKADQNVTALKIGLSSVQADDNPRVFTQIKIVYTFTGHNLSQTQVERAVKLSATKYCGASITLEKTATITHEVIIHNL